MFHLPRLSPWQKTVALLPPLVVLLFVYLLFGSIQRRREVLLGVRQSHEVVGRLNELRARLVEAETGQRGYLLTGDESFLAPYRGASGEITRLLTQLRETRPKTGAFGQLGPLIGRRFRLLEEGIVLRRSGRVHEAGQMVTEAPGRELMSRIRAELLALEAEETRELAAYEVTERRRSLMVLWVLFAGAAVVGFVAWSTNRSFARHAQSVQTLNHELTSMNERLRTQAEELAQQTRALRDQHGALATTTHKLESSNNVLQQYRAYLEDSAAELETSNSELKRVNKLLEQRTDEAEGANRAKMGFLTSMSHELRTPLNAITGYVDLLDAGVYGPLTDAQSNSIERIRHNSRHLLVLINDILSFAKLAAGRIDLRLTAVSLDELLLETEKVMVPLFAAKSISFRTTGGSNVRVRGDRDRVRQILLNLLSNAVKYTDSGGAVVMSTRSDGERVRIQVQDSGWGIPKEMQDVIFDPFVQLGGGPGGALSEGAGLGLAISRELARAMNGELSVESEVGVGSTFTLTLECAIMRAA